MPRDALLIIDVQNDFLTGGPLAVPRGDEVIPIANRYSPHFDLIVATQDWHPPTHVSFVENHTGRHVGDVVEIDGLQQVLWPAHCIAGTHGAALADRLDASRIAHYVHKGTDLRIDSYSAFFDNARRRATGLAEYLRSHGVSEVYLLGLATDYCVAATARDALQEGFGVTLIVDGCRGLDLPAGSIEAALADLRARGARLINSHDLPSSLS